MVVIQSPEDAQALIARHRKAFRADKTRSLAARKAQLKRCFDMVQENKERFVEALQADLGKARHEALLADIGSVESEIASLVDGMEEWSKPEYPSVPLINKFDGCHIVPEPYGMCLIIAPWNYPVQLTLGPMCGAIAGGNTVVIKPSEVTENTSALFDELIPKYMDPEWISCVTGAVKETTLLLNEKWDHIFYTGSTVVGKIVMEKAAKHLTPVTLELGGKSPCIVDKTANLNVAAHRIMWGKTMNAGQTCIAPDYIICEEAIQPALIEEMKKVLKEFYQGNVEETKDYGRIVNARHFDRISAMMEGATVALGGKTNREKLFIEPTVLTGVNGDSPVMQSEIFGPLLPMISSPSVENTIDFINDRDKPLALYMFSNNKQAINQVLSRTSAGGVCVNDTIMHVATPALPFGGVGPSGIGAYHGKHTFDCFTHKKPIMHKGLGMESLNKMRYPPFNPKKTAKLIGFLMKTPDWSGAGKAKKKLVKLGLLVVVAGLVAYLAF
eukprot:TRINITY_DN5622_c0_g1_i1.p1 TRINITY_DN5622_c0_g1~~TRINITY_DN5622_c0_g1_i1.p1  ORF type:complete len:499 (+),score=89.47 TRINITY_DN5622_c0_g1_i1:44-1540(+)